MHRHISNAVCPIVVWAMSVALCAFKALCRASHALQEAIDSGSFVERAEFLDDAGIRLDVTDAVSSLRLAQGFGFGILDAVPEDVVDTSSSPRIVVRYRAGVRAFTVIIRHARRDPMAAQSPFGLVVTPDVFSLRNVRYLGMAEDGCGTVDLTPRVSAAAGPAGAFGADIAPGSSISIPLRWILGTSRPVKAVFAQGDSIVVRDVSPDEELRVRPRGNPEALANE